MNGLHSVGPLVQCPHKLEVENAADQAADAAGGEEDHLSGHQRDTQTGEDSQEFSITSITRLATAGQMNSVCVCSSLTNT